MSCLFPEPSLTLWSLPCSVILVDFADVIKSPIGPMPFEEERQIAPTNEAPEVSAQAPTDEGAERTDMGLKAVEKEPDVGDVPPATEVQESGERSDPSPDEVFIADRLHYS